MTKMQDRRAAPRISTVEPAMILLGETTRVFAETLNLSAGGLCLRRPNRFSVQIGEAFEVTSARIGDARPMRVVGISHDALHFAFAPEAAPGHRSGEP